MIKELKLSVKPIPNKETYFLILNFHYAKRIPCIQYAFGLYQDTSLIGCVTYGQPASPYIKVSLFGANSSYEILELNRLVIIKDIPNAASYLIGQSLHYLPKDITLVSYSDTAYGHVGYVYQATNWSYAGRTKERTDKYSESGHARHYQKDETRRQFRSAKYRYWLCRNKHIRKQVFWPSLPYPKEETHKTIERI